MRNPCAPTEVPGIRTLWLRFSCALAEVLVRPDWGPRVPRLGTPCALSEASVPLPGPSCPLAGTSLGPAGLDTSRVDRWITPKEHRETAPKSARAAAPPQDTG
ncbi:hypothetical protein NDU88_000633 [Pleurodeles waltl]|uniref:Uncharacterized protein n=1 Tax=Pleurodeles waltl TaxID=8319 RepID=A0AAV7Q7J0_PLEWA|nr:hypothetical protein NDU88_000633 [Pleurodeles waltl]